MGICASCLGLNRHPSHKQAETEGLLNSRRSSHYGTIEQDVSASEDLDGEDAQHERQALEQISARAADDMIDVLHVNPDPAQPHPAQTSEVLPSEDEHAEDAEQAWLQDLPVNELDQEVTVKGSYAGNLVIDVAQLREQNQGAARRAL